MYLNEKTLNQLKVPHKGDPAEGSDLNILLKIVMHLFDIKPNALTTQRRGIILIKTDVGSQINTKIPQVHHMYNNLNINLLYILRTLIPINFLTYLYPILCQLTITKSGDLAHLICKIDDLSDSDIYLP